MKMTKLFIALMILLLVFTSCTQNEEQKNEKENSDEQISEDNFEENATPEPESGLLGKGSDEVQSDSDTDDLEELLKMGLENKNQYNGVYYKTEFVGKDGEVFTSETWINIVTNESKIDYLFLDEDGDLTRITLYKLLDGTHIHSPSDNFTIDLPLTASQLGDDIPLVPLVPGEPITVEDISNGPDLLEFKGYEESVEGEFIVYAHKIEGRAHTIWLNKKTGLIVKQTIASDEGVMEFYDYRYFDIDKDEFVLPDDT